MSSGYIIVEAIFLISAIIAASAFSTTMYSMINDINQIQKENLQKVKNKITTSFKIIFAYGKAGNSSIVIWVKNLGGENLQNSLIRLFDIYVKTPSDIIRLSQGDWTYSIVNDVNVDGRWGFGETLEMVINLGSPLAKGDYTVKLVSYNGQVSSYSFSV